MTVRASSTASRLLFVLTILVGSFLLFLLQPLVARAALPRLGGAPNVWNSAMLVYQALLLGGYAYAHWLGRFAVRRQATIHLALLALAALTLPIALANLPPPLPGWEALWVPALFAASIGPVFFLVSAQAPLMQRWYAADGRAGDPYALYAASNFGSFAGLVSYPLLVEPLMPLRTQDLAWSAGYLVLGALVAACARVRGRAVDTPPGGTAESTSPPPPVRTILLWLALAAVPSGLMLSTTTFLTTDIFAMSLLWVIPLGLYLLSFVLAFSAESALAAAISRSAPLIVLLAGGLAMSGRSSGSMSQAVATVVLLFVIAVTLHSRLHALRPPPDRLTLFYLVMSAGGALGGLFCALLAPVAFDWVWEHPLLVIAAAALIPQQPLLRWMDNDDIPPATRKLVIATCIASAVALGLWMAASDPENDHLLVLVLSLGIAACGIMVLGRRWAFVAVLVAMLIGRGGGETAGVTFAGARTRSYFGIYTVRDSVMLQQRSLAHGTTLHGLQFTDPVRRLQPTTYYGPTSGAGLALREAAENARVGVVGLGTATLACYRRPGQAWTFFEIDPAVVAISRERHLFSFLDTCAPQATIRLGDARLALAGSAPASFDVLMIDAFSSDSIPLHLLTKEALAIYGRAISPDGVLMLHISNRYMDLRPVVAALAATQGWQARLRFDNPQRDGGLTPSYWVALTRNADRIDRLVRHDPAQPWTHLKPKPGQRPWSDDHSSILPFIRWNNVLGTKL